MLKNTHGPNVEEIIGKLKPPYLRSSQFLLLGIENRKTVGRGM
jgi:hypothetical protein